MSAVYNIMSAPKWQQRPLSRQRHRMVKRRQRKVNQISNTLDSLQIEPSSLDVGSGELLQAVLAVLASLWQRKLLVGAIVATVLVLGIIAVRVISPGYTAETYILGVFLASDAAAKDENSNNVPSIGLDLTRVIEARSRFLQSTDLARRVVQQLGLEQLRPEISASHWLPDKFYGNAANIKEDQTDRAATRLLRHLSVTSDPRAYLIKVRYTASDPALAVVIANAFVAEFLRSSKLQTLSQQRSSAEATLSRQLAKFGVKYPRVAQTRMVMAATDDLLKDQLSKVPEAILQAAGENVTKAIIVPSSLTLPFLIGLIGLVIGTGVALWLERGRWWKTFSQYYTRPFA